MSRIADKRVTGRASFERHYAIGYHNCTACKAETPDPPQQVLDDLCSDGFDESYVWANQHWDVPGWINIHGYGWICDRCARAVMVLLTARGKGESPLAASDLALLEEAIQKALALANEGLLTAYPAPPKVDDQRSPFNYDTHRYKDPLRNAYYRDLAEYRQGALRARIREIRNVLMGRKPGDDP